MVDAREYEEELNFCLNQTNALLSKENKDDCDWRALFVHFKLLSQLCHNRKYGLEAHLSHYCPTSNYLDCGDATEKLGCSPSCYICSTQCFLDSYGSEYQGVRCRVCGQVIPRETYARLLGA